MENPMMLLDRAAGVRGGRHDLSALKDRLAQWWQNYLTRLALRQLDPRLLRDVGLTPEQQRRECARPFYDIGRIRL